MTRLICQKEHLKIKTNWQKSSYIYMLEKYSYDNVS